MTSFNDNSPVFCTAEVPADLTNFFEEAYSPSELVEELGAENVRHADRVAKHLGVLINTEDISAIIKPTLPPVSDQSLSSFKGESTEDVWAFAQQNIKYPPIYNGATAILDGQAIKDKETCVLVTRRSLPKQDQSELIIVHSNFKSALMILNIGNMAIAGDEHFEQPDSDGVIRYSWAWTTRPTVWQHNVGQLVYEGSR